MGIAEFTPEQLEQGAVLRPKTIATRVPATVSLEAQQLAEEIAHRWGATASEMLSNRPGSRVKHLAAARTELYVALRARGWSYQAIGKFAGGRDHTTVIAAVRSV